MRYWVSGKPALLILMILFGTNSAFSSSYKPLTDRQLYQPLVTISVGPDFVRAGRAQTLTLLPPFQNHYTNSNPAMTVANGGVFVGVERALNERLWIQLGVSGYKDSHLNLEGDVWRFASPEFDVLGYSYQVQHTRVMVEGKVLTRWRQDETLHPYLSWGLGAAFNDANTYEETSLVPGVSPTFAFKNNMQTSFTWAIGAGADYIVNPDLRLGMGYQFADLGSASLGTTPAAATSNTLNFPHIYASQVRFQCTLLL